MSQILSKKKNKNLPVKQHCKFPFQDHRQGKQDPKSKTLLIAGVGITLHCPNRSVPIRQHNNFFYENRKGRLFLKKSEEIRTPSFRSYLQRTKQTKWRPACPKKKNITKLESDINVGEQKFQF